MGPARLPQILLLRNFLGCIVGIYKALWVMGGAQNGPISCLWVGGGRLRSEYRSRSPPYLAAPPPCLASGTGFLPSQYLLAGMWPLRPHSAHHVLSAMHSTFECILLNLVQSNVSLWVTRSNGSIAVVTEVTPFSGLRENLFVAFCM